MDRQTDGQTDRRTDRNLIVKTALHSMQRGKKLILLSYLSYLFRLQLLSEDCYLLEVEGLQSAERTKTHPKANLQMHPLLPKTEATLMLVYSW